MELLHTCTSLPHISQLETQLEEEAEIIGVVIGYFVSVTYTNLKEVALLRNLNF